MRSARKQEEAFQRSRRVTFSLKLPFEHLNRETQSFARDRDRERVAESGRKARARQREVLGALDGTGKRRRHVLRERANASFQLRDTQLSHPET